MTKKRLAQITVIAPAMYVEVFCRVEQLFGEIEKHSNLIERCAFCWVQMESLPPRSSRKKVLQSLEITAIRYLDVMEIHLPAVLERISSILSLQISTWNRNLSETNWWSLLFTIWTVSPRKVLQDELRSLLNPSSTRRLYPVVIGQHGVGKTTLIQLAVNASPIPKGVHLSYFDVPIRDVSPAPFIAALQQSKWMVCGPHTWCIYPNVMSSSVSGGS